MNRMTLSKIQSLAPFCPGFGTGPPLNRIASGTGFPLHRHIKLVPLSEPLTEEELGVGRSEQ